MKFALIAATALICVAARPSDRPTGPPHHHGGPGGPHGGPPFHPRPLGLVWKELTPEQATELRALLNPEKSRDEVKKAVQEWIQNTGSEKIQAAYEQSETDLNQWRQEQDAEVEKQIEKETTDDLKNAFAEFKKFRDDDSLNMQQLCEKTEQLRKTLSIDIQRKAGMPPPNRDCSKPPHPEHDHHHHHHGPPPPLRFVLPLLTEEQTKEVRAIFNPAKPRGEVKKALQEWIQNTGDAKIQAAFEKSEALITQQHQKRDAEVEKQIETETTDDLKNAFAALKKYRDDDSLNMQQMCEKTEEFRKTISFDIQRKLGLPPPNRDCSQPPHHHHHHGPPPPPPPTGEPDFDSAI